MWNSALRNVPSLVLPLVCLRAFMISYDDTLETPEMNRTLQRNSSDARLDLSGRILAVGIPASAYDNDRHRPHSASYQKSRPRQASSDAFWDVTDTEVAQNPS
ncbi:hypothetical protein M8818_007510 [Zalaria obscura]|uniref:Uncharacterized protein n=1 Tax=Zalaria obscura TaxID=2024903 RepID=A0ACC3S3E2_9PEZI